jgi:protein-tyrosine-phosphatase
MKVLFVCRGNMGRSQMAEAIFNKLAPEGYASISVGTNVFDKEGNSMEGQTLINRIGAEQVLEVLRELDIEAGLAVRNQITKSLVDESDVVVVMAEKETWPEYLVNSGKVIYWEIIDPKAKGINETRQIRDQIAEWVEKLIAEIK